eukprot:Em0919g2a
MWGQDEGLSSEGQKSVVDKPITAVEERHHSDSTVEGDMVPRAQKRLAEKWGNDSEWSVPRVYLLSILAAYTGAVGSTRVRMSKPLLLPEPYGGEAGGWAEWVDHFENVATVNKWATGEEKKWLKVRLTGKAQTAFKKLPQDVKENYGECMKSLQRRFDPDSKRQLYVAELSARTRHKDEDWATFGDVLRVLADKAYPDLEEKARERLALNQFLAQIENAQVAFGVKQKRPTNVEEAVVATIELESYLGSSGKPLRVSAVSPQEPDPDVRVRRADRAEAVAAVSPLDEPQTVKLLGERLQRLEMLLERQGSSTRPRTSKQTWEAESGKRKAVVCWTCGKKGHIARFCRSRATEQHQGNFSPSVERAYHVLFKGTPFMVTCIVTDDITIEAILGLDFLEANSCVIDCGQKVLTFPSQKLSIPFLSKTTTEQGVATVGLVLKEKTVVPAGSEMEVMVKIAGPVTNGTWFVGHKSATCNGVMVANAVVSPSSNVVPVRILNPRDEMVVLKKGTQIASMELLEQDPVINISTVMKNAEVSLECQNILWDLVSKTTGRVNEIKQKRCPTHYPRVDDTLDTLVGSKFFTTLDLASGVLASGSGLPRINLRQPSQHRKDFTNSRQQVTFLGHIVTDPSKTEAVSKWPIPQNRKEVQQFLGLANYYRRFFLAYPDYERRFILDTDASDVGIGAVLSQVSDCGSERVIAYASRSLTRPEQRQCGRDEDIESENTVMVGVVSNPFQKYTPAEMRQMQLDDTTIQPVHCAAKLPIDLMYGTNQMEPNTTSEYARCLKDALQEAYALLFLVVDPESYTILGKDPLRLKPCVISDDKPENTGSENKNQLVQIWIWLTAMTMIQYSKKRQQVRNCEPTCATLK